MSCRRRRPPTSGCNLPGTPTRLRAQPGGLRAMRRPEPRQLAGGLTGRRWAGNRSLRKPFLYSRFRHRPCPHPLSPPNRSRPNPFRYSPTGQGRNCGCLKIRQSDRVRRSMNSKLVVPEIRGLTRDNGLHTSNDPSTGGAVRSRNPSALPVLCPISGNRLTFGIDRHVISPMSFADFCRSGRCTGGSQRTTGGSQRTRAEAKEQGRKPKPVGPRSPTGTGVFQSCGSRRTTTCTSWAPTRGVH